ncbi:hypothetical protein [Halostella salina]|uniref:hypothetical protein n=1 Tax=Halostella salina TaxID=1547897 RepID=UPI000EF81DBD|nr:hypothetical protein [Halostella salina]
MREILSRLRSRWTDLLSSRTAPGTSVTGGTIADARSVDLYECSACESVLIEPPSEACSQCRSGTLEKV